MLSRFAGCTLESAITSVMKRKTYATVRQLMNFCFASQERDTAALIVAHVRHCFALF